jgi:hypothetical protein
MPAASALPIGPGSRAEVRPETVQRPQKVHPTAVGEALPGAARSAYPLDKQNLTCQGGAERAIGVPERGWAAFIWEIPVRTRTWAMFASERSSRTASAVRRACADGGSVKAKRRAPGVGGEGARIRDGGIR